MSAGVSALPFPGIQSANDFLRMADIGLMDAKQTHNCVMSRNANSDPSDHPPAYRPWVKFLTARSRRSNGARVRGRAADARDRRGG